LHPPAGSREWARTKLKPRLTLQIAKRPGDLHTFQLLPRRRVVERILAWITRRLPSRTIAFGRAQTARLLKNAARPADNHTVIIELGVDDAEPGRDRGRGTARRA
jgi:hypothetical protein